MLPLHIGLILTQHSDTLNDVYGLFYVYKFYILPSKAFLSIISKNNREYRFIYSVKTADPLRNQVNFLGISQNFIEKSDSG